MQPLGTARIGRAFGPIMAALVRRHRAARHLRHRCGIPQCCRALNPIYGLTYLATGGATGFLVLGGVFLCVTGAEALYADMGHFGTGADPARLVRPWSSRAFAQLRRPGGAGARRRADRRQHLLPALPRAAAGAADRAGDLATIIASQSIITGAFSMTRQAIQLGWLPRLRITQTSAAGLRTDLRRRRSTGC